MPRGSKRKRDMNSGAEGEDDSQHPGQGQTEQEGPVPGPRNINARGLAEDDYDKVSLDAWLKYDRKLSAEEAVQLLERRLKSKHPNEIRMLLKANDQLLVGTANAKRHRIASGIVFGFSHPCKHCGAGVYPVYTENGSLKGFHCGGGYDQTVGRVQTCGIVSKSGGARSFKSPYSYVEKYLDYSGAISFLPSNHPDQSTEGRAGQLYRRSHGGKNFKKKSGYNPAPIFPWGW